MSFTWNIKVQLWVSQLGHVPCLFLTHTHMYAEVRAHTNVLLIRLDGVFTPAADTFDSDV